MLTDWMGNEIKVGDSVCFIQTEIRHPEMGLMMCGDGYQKTHDAYTERCWLPQEAYTVGVGLTISNTIRTWDGCIITSTESLQSILSFWDDKTVLLAIVGKSDKEPEIINQ